MNLQLTLFLENPGCNFERTKCAWRGDKEWKLSVLSPTGLIPRNNQEKNPGKTNVNLHNYFNHWAAIKRRFAIKLYGTDFMLHFLGAKYYFREFMQSCQLSSKPKWSVITEMILLLRYIQKKPLYYKTTRHLFQCLRLHPLTIAKTRVVYYVRYFISFVISESIRYFGDILQASTL